MSTIVTREGVRAPQARHMQKGVWQRAWVGAIRELASVFGRASLGGRVVRAFHLRVAAHRFEGVSKR